MAQNSGIELSERCTVLTANNVLLTNKRKNHGTLEIQLLDSVPLPHSLRHDSKDCCTEEWLQTLIMVHYKPCMPDLCTAISRGGGYIGGLPQVSSAFLRLQTDGTHSDLRPVSIGSPVLNPGNVGPGPSWGLCLTLMYFSPALGTVF